MGGEGGRRGGWEWEGRGFKPNGTATEHREEGGRGPFGLESLYISALVLPRNKTDLYGINAMRINGK
jgi:hypothetical protein